MDNDQVSSELPPHYEELKKAAKRTANWRERLKAVEELGQWKNQKVIDLLKHVVADDAVYTVREAAYGMLQQFGEDISPPSRKKGDLIKDASKILLRIKKSLPEGHTVEAFKEKLQRTRIDVYDTYEGERGADFDQWLASTWASLSGRESKR